ncbi:MAG: hypothetical protein GX085_00120 [Firmicutes bacterium]|nr:hypothetical protein [Bacillota bacterium]
MKEDLNEQVAYLRGLVEGRDLNTVEDTEILWKRVVQILDLAAGEVGRLHKEQEQLREYIEAIDEDLGYLEDHYYPAENPEEEEAELQIGNTRVGDTRSTAPGVEETPH